MFLIVFNIVAIVNLLLLSVLLLSIKPHTLAKKFLAIILLEPALLMVFDMLAYWGISADYPVIDYATFLYDFLWAPLFYYFVMLVIRKKHWFSAKSLFNFSFFIVCVLFFIWFAFQSAGYRRDVLIRTMSADHYPLPFYVLGYLIILQDLVCLVFCHHIVRKYNREIEQKFPHTENASVRWLQGVIVLSFILCTVMYLPSLVRAKIYVCLFLVPLVSLVLYTYLVYKAISTPLVFPADLPEVIDQTDAEDETADKQNHNHAKDDNNELSDAIETMLVNTKLYLDSEINIQTLADLCCVRVHVLSAYLKRHYYKNFNNFINYYRVEEAKRFLTDPEQHKYSINHIAKNSGFTSRSAFYNAFKKNTGFTPGEYLKMSDARENDSL
ncbi:MAG TPA: helix-turn-helix transcriptional regulator [Bacteroidales bacterium]|nr:helix-turn-helix transcriptional regulator [Bacteroidales bacterium]